MDNVDAPMYKYVSLRGTNSTVNFNSLKRFSDPQKLSFQSVLSTILGKSFMNIGVPFKFNETVSDFEIVSLLVSSFLSLGKSLIEIGNTGTFFHFEFVYKSLTTEFIRAIVDSIDLDFTDSQHGSVHEEMIGNELLTVEIQNMPGREVIVLLKTLVLEDRANGVDLETIEMGSDVLQKTATDIITFDKMTVEDYLKEDPKNIVIFSKLIPHFTNLKTWMLSCRMV